MVKRDFGLAYMLLAGNGKSNMEHEMEIGGLWGVPIGLEVSGQLAGSS